MHFHKKKSFQVLTRRGRKSPNVLKFGILIGHLPSDGAASMAVKGLIQARRNRFLTGSDSECFVSWPARRKYDTGKDWGGGGGCKKI